MTVPAGAQAPSDVCNMIPGLLSDFIMPGCGWDSTAAIENLDGNRRRADAKSPEIAGSQGVGCGSLNEWRLVLAVDPPEAAIRCVVRITGGVELEHQTLVTMFNVTIEVADVGTLVMAIR